ncbi:hypothetical protein XM38_013050 [Halomicronema hongdechloris C2206]|uniref:Uncharacterized protein n=1 Tax=Halomicronema hongdechloris C2206 TaxID=1641165 RepID=A0A1Z3HJV4_9CYAN|nr:hypothetical protein [Halomicronema hongdechloris]ASC70367.1 hypothetical protein XM38_013050 [Halomicronema hongdechloris C2206]
MTHAFRTKARIQYSSQDELDVAVIDYCRGRSRHDLHARTRSALNGFYGPFAMAAMAASEDEIRRQAMRSIRQLTTQIAEIKEQFFPELLSPEVLSEPHRLDSLAFHVDPKERCAGSTSMKIVEPSKTAVFPDQSLPADGPADEQLRAFLGDDAAIMAGLNPFINDLT